MANNPGDDFFEQILGYQTYSESGLPAGTVVAGGSSEMVQLSSGEVGYEGGVFPLGLSLAGGGFGNVDEPLRFRDNNVGDRHMSSSSSSLNYAYSGQPMPITVAAMPHQPATRPRIRARRGQATDPHSIAERLRRGRIAERNKALQDLVPSVNKTDRAAMLDEIVDYVKFLQLQVKVLSMSRLGGAGAVAPLVTDIPTYPVEDENGEGASQPVWEKWSSDGTEKQVAKLMEENVGAAMQFLQSKALCIMPISLASAIYHTQLPDTTSIVKPETYPPS